MLATSDGQSNLRRDVAHVGDGYISDDEPVHSDVPTTEDVFELRLLLGCDYSTLLGQDVDCALIEWPMLRVNKEAPPNRRSDVLSALMQRNRQSQPRIDECASKDNLLEYET